MADLASTTTQPPYFEGYFVDGGSTQAINCATTEFFSIDGNFAGCCPTDSACQIITQCADGTVQGIPGAIGCLSPGGCITMTVFDNYPSGNLLYSDLICGQNWAASSVYRTVDAAALATSSSSSAKRSSSSSTSTGATSGSSATLAPQTSASTTTFSTSPGQGTSTSTSSGAGGGGGGGGGSQAWIAGAVIGALAVIAALVLLAFWLGRRSNQRKAAEGHIAGYAHQSFKNQNPQEMVGSYPGVHLNQQRPVELVDNGTGYAGHTPSPPSQYGQQQYPAEVG